jgi:hypothetical protein
MNSRRESTERVFCVASARMWDYAVVHNAGVETSKRRKKKRKEEKREEQR